MPYTHLSDTEREELSRGLAADESVRAIAGRLGRHHTTLSREWRRNGPWDPAAYRAVPAAEQAAERARVPRRSRTLFTDAWLWGYVVGKLREDWSPAQISRRLQTDYPQDMAKRISPEAIYQALYVLPKGTLRAELLAHLRRRHRRRRKRGLLHDRRGQIPHMVRIQERPQAVEHRRIPGHWEGDLLVGRRHQSALGVLVERTSRLTLLAKLRNQEAAEARRAFGRAFQTIPPALRQSLTYDRGREMTEHERLTAQTAVQVYFCDPQAPAEVWERCLGGALKS